VTGTMLVLGMKGDVHIWGDGSTFKGTTSSGSIATVCWRIPICRSTSRGSTRPSSTNSAAGRKCPSTCAAPASPTA
jgi:hypothetical protein